MKVFVIIFSAVTAINTLTAAKHLRSDISENFSETPKIVHDRDVTILGHKTGNNFNVHRKRDVKHLNITYLPPKMQDMPSSSVEVKGIDPPFAKLSDYDLTTEVPAASEQKTEILLKSEETFIADILQDTAVLAEDGYHYKNPSEIQMLEVVKTFDRHADNEHLPTVSEINGDIREADNDSNVSDHDNHAKSSHS